MENLKYYLLFLVLIFYSTIFVKKYTDTMKKDPSQKGKKYSHVIAGARYLRLIALL